SRGRGAGGSAGFSSARAGTGRFSGTLRGAVTAGAERGDGLGTGHVAPHQRHSISGRGSFSGTCRALPQPGQVYAILMLLLLDAQGVIARASEGGRDENAIVAVGGTLEGETALRANVFGQLLAAGVMDAQVRVEILAHQIDLVRLTRGHVGGVYLV